MPRKRKPSREEKQRHHAASWEEAKAIEKEGLAILEPLIAYESDGRYVLTDKGRLSREMQLKYGDIVTQEGRDMVWSEIKIERRKFVPRWQKDLPQERQGNLFLEEYSNLSRYTLGWMYHLDSDRLLYYFLEEDQLYSWSFPKLKHWAFKMPALTMTDTAEQAKREGYHGRFWDWPRKQQGVRVQLNDAWGRVVPINHLLNLIPHRISKPKADFAALKDS